MVEKVERFWHKNIGLLNFPIDTVVIIMGLCTVPNASRIAWFAPVLA